MRSIVIISFLGCVIAQPFSLDLQSTTVKPDEYLKTWQIIEKYGYPVEEHFVTTKDGYILRMQRIPPTRSSAPPNGRTIFLLHGLTMSSFNWVLLGPDNALAFVLSDLGYDVWMGNVRGNSESRNHTKLKPTQKKFWKFSYHEIGIIDHPAMIDYVLKITKQKALYHVGYSQGTTLFYVTCSELPQYNKKIIEHYSLAPVAILKHTKSPLMKITAELVRPISIMTGLFGIHKLFEHSSLFYFIADHVCSEHAISEPLCRDMMFLLFGFDRSEFNDTILSDFMGHFPAGCSTKQIVHYGQNIKSGEFRLYDYSPFNALHYGPRHAIKPPLYKLEKIVAPVHILYAPNDWLVDTRDAEALCQKLGNCKSKTLIDHPDFNHLDFVTAIHAKTKVYDLMIKRMNETIK